jgi:D-amino-acid dehydrogenase
MGETMDEVERASGAPRRAVVVGAGIVGLATAWHLQRYGVEVVVAERGDRVPAGASWGNAGWLSPGLVAPLPEPAVLRHALGLMIDPSNAIYAPPTLERGHWAFLTRFALHATAGEWRRAAASYAGIARIALDAYDELAEGGVGGRTVEAPIDAAFAHRKEAVPFRRGLRRLADAGMPLQLADLDGDEARALAPHLSERVAAALRIDGQRLVDPGAFVASLADAFVGAGGSLRTGVDVTALRRTSAGFELDAPGHEPLRADVVVLATGAWLERLAPGAPGRPAVRAGRGCSMTVDAAPAPSCAVYLPHAHVACSPYRGALRLSGAMEISSASAPLDRRRLDAVERAARPLLAGVDWGSRRDTWVGPRPITADGLPVVGVAGTEGLFVASGHGMWGMTLGPATGKLLALYVVTGTRPPAIAGFDPLRRLRPLRRRH